LTSQWHTDWKNAKKLVPAATQKAFTKRLGPSLDDFETHKKSLLKELEKDAFKSASRLMEKVTKAKTTIFLAIEAYTRAIDNLLVAQMPKQKDVLEKLAKIKKEVGEQYERLSKQIENAAQSQELTKPGGKVAFLKKQVLKSYEAVKQAQTKTMSPSDYKDLLSQGLRSIGANVKLASAEVPPEKLKQLLLFVQSVKEIWSGDAVPDESGIAQRLKEDLKRVEQVKRITDTL
jgi:23S rRNA A1618 N6-methylase RlmF